MGIRGLLGKARRSFRLDTEPFVPPTAMDRPLTKDEDAALRFILGLDDFPGAADLRGQVAHVRAIGGRITELDLDVTDGPAAAVKDGILPVCADVVGPNGEPIGFITVWVKSGYLSALEYSWVTDRMPTEYPTLDQLREGSTRPAQRKYY